MKTITKLLSVIFFSVLPIALNAQAPTTTVGADKPKAAGSWQSKYEWVGYFSEELASVEDRKGNFGYVNIAGKLIIPIKYSCAGEFSHGLAAVCINDGVSKGASKFGFIDKTGKVIIPIKYDVAWGFSEGLASVKINGKYGFIDVTGATIIPFQYSNTPIHCGFKNGIAQVYSDGRWIYIDKTGKEVK